MDKKFKNIIFLYYGDKASQMLAYPNLKLLVLPNYKIRDFWFQICETCFLFQLGNWQQENHREVVANANSVRSKRRRRVQEVTFLVFHKFALPTTWWVAAAWEYCCACEGTRWGRRRRSPGKARRKQREKLPRQRRRKLVGRPRSFLQRTISMPYWYSWITSD